MNFHINTRCVVWTEFMKQSITLLPPKMVFHHQKIAIMASNTEEFFLFEGHCMNCGFILSVWLLPLYCVFETHLCNCTFGYFYIVFDCMTMPTHCINTSCVYVMGCSHLWQLCIALFEELLHISSVKHSHLFLLAVYLVLLLGHCIHVSSVSWLPQIV